MAWLKIKEGLSNSYPITGQEVLVSDGKHYDIAYYLEYPKEDGWFKKHVKKDKFYDFDSFIPTKWKALPIGEERSITMSDIDNMHKLLHHLIVNESKIIKTSINGIGLGG